MENTDSTLTNISQATPPQHLPVKKTVRQKTFGLRFILMLIFGIAFTFTFFSIVNLLVYNIIGSENTSGNDSYTILLVLFIVFGAAHLLLSFSTAKDLDRQSKPKTYTNVLLSIYSAILAIVFIVALINILVRVLGLFTGTALKLSDADRDTIISGIIVMFTTAFMVLGQWHLVPRIPRKVYPITMSALSGVVLILSLCISAPSIRGVNHDNLISSDLKDIQTLVDNYIGNNHKLPDNLADTDDTGSTYSYTEHLHASFDSYEYIPGEVTTDNNKSYSYYSRTTTTYHYQLCADFNTDQDKYNYSHYGSPNFYSHSAGHYCFDVSKESVDYSNSYRGIMDTY